MWNVERSTARGDYGEFIAPNSILYTREKRLYVSYVREDGFVKKNRKTPDEDLGAGTKQQEQASKGLR